MAAAVVKSCVYLGVFGSLGYVLMRISEPSEEKRKQIAKTGYKDPSSDESLTKKEQFLKKLQEASTDTPIYLKKPGSVTSKQSEDAPKQPTKREIN